jgi:hypothetical protein
VAADVVSDGALCSVGGSVTGCGQVTGVVLSVDGPSDIQVDGFTLRTPAGQIYDFAVGRLELSGGGLPAPHLRAHLLSGVPIVVEYKIDGGQYVALRYRDAST